MLTNHSSSRLHKYACITYDTPGRQGAQEDLAAVDLMWDNNSTLSYCFLNGYQDSDGARRGHQGSPAQQAKVRNVITAWEKFANIRFEHDTLEKAIIRITFDGDEASWSKVGRSAVWDNRSEEPTMNLANIGDNEVVEGMERGVILHEFGHALGLGHEHQSPAEIGRLTHDNEAIIDSISDRGEHPLMVVTNSSNLDLRSIMMCVPRHTNEEYGMVVTTDELSEVDKAYITLQYPFESPGPNAWTIEKALDVVSVDPQFQEKFIQSYKSQSYNPKYWKDIRMNFKMWYVSRPPVMQHVEKKRKRKATDPPQVRRHSRRTSRNVDDHARDSEDRPTSPSAMKTAFKTYIGDQDPRFWFGRIPTHLV